jgi:VIT1/CCC1 family predicted Fe2+/Mn2+ transporter
MPHPVAEHHFVGRTGWLRAAVLGANDGIISTASVIMGVAASGAPPPEILISGISALVAGAMSMAAGEYVSVSSQADTEKADLARERDALEDDADGEHEELTQIYVDRGLDRSTAREVATQLTAHDALGAHARDELGISELSTARPVQAALTSAATFVAGAICPFIVALAASPADPSRPVAVWSLLFLGMLGAIGARTGGADIWRGAARVLFWGALAMGLTTGIGMLAGTVI